MYRTRDTLFCIIRSASPSAIADFPTPGSPISNGLFFFLLLSICDTLSISFSLPTTGSNFSSSARLVMSLPKLSKTGVLDFFVAFESVEGIKGFSFGSSLSFSSGKEDPEGNSS